MILRFGRIKDDDDDDDDDGFEKRRLLRSNERN